MRNVNNDEMCDSVAPFINGENRITELSYADDTVRLSNSVRGLEKIILSVKRHSEDTNLFLKKVNRQKDEEIENVTHFEYLCFIINSTGEYSKEDRRRLVAIAKKRRNIGSSNAEVKQN